MFGKGKKKDGPISPPASGSWEFTFMSELEAAVHRREQKNQELSAALAAKTSRVSFGSHSSYGGLLPNNAAFSKVSSPNSVSPASTPSPVSPTREHFDYNQPRKLSADKGIVKAHSIPVPAVPVQEKDVPKKKTSDSSLIRFEDDTERCDNSRGSSVSSFISMFNAVAEEESPEPSPSKMRTRATTVAAQTDLNSSKFYIDVRFCILVVAKFLFID